MGVAVHCAVIGTLSIWMNHIELENENPELKIQFRVNRVMPCHASARPAWPLHAKTVCCRGKSCQVPESQKRDPVE